MIITLVGAATTVLDDLAYLRGLSRIGSVSGDGNMENRVYSNLRAYTKNFIARIQHGYAPGERETMLQILRLVTEIVPYEYTLEELSTDFSSVLLQLSRVFYVTPVVLSNTRFRLKQDWASIFDYDAHEVSSRLTALNPEGENVYLVNLCTNISAAASIFKGVMENPFWMALKMLHRAFIAAQELMRRNAFSPDRLQHVLAQRNISFFDIFENELITYTVPKRKPQKPALENTDRRSKNFHMYRNYHQRLSRDPLNLRRLANLRSLKHDVSLGFSYQRIRDMANAFILNDIPFTSEEIERRFDKLLKALKKIVLDTGASYEDLKNDFLNAKYSPEDEEGLDINLIFSIPGSENLGGEYGMDTVSRMCTVCGEPADFFMLDYDLCGEVCQVRLWESLVRCGINKIYI